MSKKSHQNTRDVQNAPDVEEEVTEETRSRRRSTIPSEYMRRGPDSARLIELSGPRPGRVHYLGREAVIGRDDGVSVEIDSGDVSRRHARLWRGRDGWRIEDLDSRNGTLVNSVPTPKGTLVTGDRIQLGSQVLFLFSAQEELELQVQQARRMEAVGALAGGVAHDFNNLLTVITGNVDYLRTALRLDDLRDDVALGVLREMDSACDRASQLVQQLLRFAAARPKSAVKVVDIRRVIEDAMGLCRRTLSSLINVVVRAESKLLARADAAQLQQVLVDIAINARDAMPDGGTIIVSAAPVSVNGPGMLVPPGDYIEIRVADNGVGMSEETRQRVFEPFFSTKPRDRGTGLGLARVYASVREMGGTIRVESVLGEGTTFVLHLPVAQRRVVGSETRPLPSEVLGYELPKGLHRVLLIDDDAQVRRAVARLLEHLGCEVTHASDGLEALELTTSADTFDLWILDVQMPRLDGREALVRLRQRGFDTRVLVTSGGLDQSEINELPSLGAQAFLPKPARLLDLQEALSAVFSS